MCIYIYNTQLNWLVYTPTHVPIEYKRTCFSHCQKTLLLWRVPLTRKHNCVFKAIRQQEGMELKVHVLQQRWEWLLRLQGFKDKNKLDRSLFFISVFVDMFEGRFESNPLWRSSNRYYLCELSFVFVPSALVWMILCRLLAAAQQGCVLTRLESESAKLPSEDKSPDLIGDRRNPLLYM